MASLLSSSSSLLGYDKVLELAIESSPTDLDEVPEQAVWVCECHQKDRMPWTWTLYPPDRAKVPKWATQLCQGHQQCLPFATASSPADDDKIPEQANQICKCHLQCPRHAPLKDNQYYIAKGCIRTELYLEDELDARFGRYYRIDLRSRYPSVRDIYCQQILIDKLDVRMGTGRGIRF